VCCVVVLAASVVLPLLGDAKATHFWTHRKWLKYSTQSQTNAGPYCYSTSLSNVRNLGWGGTLDALYTAYNSLNVLPAKWFIGPRIAYTTDCHSHIAAGTLPNPDTLALYGLLVLSNDHSLIVGADITINKNKNWVSSGCTTSSGLSSPPVRLSYVLRHEFAHWIELFHGYEQYQSGTPKVDPNSIIYPRYNCLSWDINIWSHDSSTLSYIYGS
jgi:hypothetical protein